MTPDQAIGAAWLGWAFIEVCVGLCVVKVTWWMAK